MRIVPVPCLKDNYAYLVVTDGGDAAVIDASEEGPVRDALRREGASLRAVWSTHHHWDHVGGNVALAAHGVEVVGHASDQARLPAMTRGVQAGDRVQVGDVVATCLHVPGHTLGAVAYFVDHGGERAVFTGDTLFCAGCGRLFEGTPAQMHESLEKLAALPEDTRVYCGHEYTSDNLRFAESVEPSNEAIALARRRAADLRGKNQPTVGTRISDERRVNPFLRTSSPEIRARFGVKAIDSDVETFAALRDAKNAFK